MKLFSSPIHSVIVLLGIATQFKQSNAQLPKFDFDTSNPLTLMKEGMNFIGNLFGYNLNKPEPEIGVSSAGDILEPTKSNPLAISGSHNYAGVDSLPPLGSGFGISHQNNDVSFQSGLLQPINSGPNNGLQNYDYQSNYNPSYPTGSENYPIGRENFVGANNYGDATNPNYGPVNPNNLADPNRKISESELSVKSAPPIVLDDIVKSWNSYVEAPIQTFPGESVIESTQVFYLRETTTPETKTFPMDRHMIDHGTATLQNRRKLPSEILVRSNTFGSILPPMATRKSVVRQEEPKQAPLEPDVQGQNGVVELARSLAAANDEELQIFAIENGYNVNSLYQIRENIRASKFHGTAVTTENKALPVHQITKDTQNDPPQKIGPLSYREPQDYVAENYYRRTRYH